MSVAQNVWHKYVGNDEKLGVGQGWETIIILSLNSKKFFLAIAKYISWSYCKDDDIKLSSQQYYMYLPIYMLYDDFEQVRALRAQWELSSNRLQSQTIKTYKFKTIRICIGA